MKINEGIKLSGSYMIHDLTTGEITVKKNLIMTALKTLIIKALNYSEESPSPAVDDMNVNYIAYGIDDTPATISDTTLGNEQFRKLLTAKSRTGNYFDVVGQLDRTEANFNIKEIGLFANGTGTADSGTLISHIIVNIDKNSNKEYNIYYKLEVS